MAIRRSPSAPSWAGWLAWREIARVPLGRVELVLRGGGDLADVRKLNDDLKSVDALESALAEFRATRDPAAARRADPLRGRFGRGQFRMPGFQRFQFAHERVVLGVGDRRFVEHVVAVVGVVELLAQLRGAPRDVGHGG